MAAETGDGAGQWTETEVAELISIWGDNSIQAKLEGSYRNRAVFECIAKEMIGRGHRRTWLQCQRKVKSLRAKFKEAKDINKRSGRGRVTCPFYDELDRILGDKPSCQPIELIDSSIETAEEEPESPGASASPAPSLNSEKGACTLGEDTPVSLTFDSASEESSSSAVSADNSIKKNAQTRNTSAKSRKRKSKMESTLEIFADKITSALKNDESELLLKMQAAQHEHDLKVLSMLTQLITRQQPPFYQQAVQAPHLYCPTQSSVIHSPPYPMASSQSPLFEMSNQSLSFQQDLAQPLPFGNALSPSHNPGQPFRPERPNPRDQAQHASFNQAFMSSYPPPDEQD
ncbi:uncharacterized protein LOC143417001 [Maylandia zebra]|uniref:uncharacterized protein LOC143417001 n=1 Tax=Maylandia zebra TaxID=106582 RepID=UPI00403D0A9B